MFYAVHDWDPFKGIRNISFATTQREAKNHHNGNQLGAHVEIGKAFFVNSLFSVRPFELCDAIFFSDQGFTEKGAASLNLNMQSSLGKLIRNELGSYFTFYTKRPGYRFVFDFKGSWVKEVRFQNGHYTCNFVDTSIPFIVTGLQPDRNLAAFGFDFTTYMMQERLAISLQYQGEMGQRYWDQSLGCYIQYSW